MSLTEIFAKTKILCTLGPATSDTDSIKKLIQAGMDGVRLNFSHGTHNSFEKLFNNIEEACKSEESPLAVLVDLQGPKMRIGDLEKDKVEIKTGDTLNITSNNIKGNEKIISTSYERLIGDANIGDQILIDDGLIRLRVSRKEKDHLVCTIENGGTLIPHKGINLPGMKLSTKSITDKDFEDLEFALKHRVDYIALSFVRSANDITILKEWLREKDKQIPIIAKIEKKEAIDDFDNILKIVDGIMIARGDLGVELPAQEVPVLQKNIIKKCNAVGKLVITATQMLESMISNPVPTRAESSDVANAVWDGTDVVMLSGETAVGKYPFKTVQLMNDIVKNAEGYHLPNKNIDFEIPETIEENLFDSVGRAVTTISKQVNAAAIVAFTLKGRTAKNLAKFRPEAKIIAFSNSFDTMNNLCLRWGVTSLFLENIDKENIAIEEAKKMILESGHVKEGDIVIFTAGAPYSEKSRANWLRFEVI